MQKAFSGSWVDFFMFDARKSWVHDPLVPLGLASSTPFVVKLLFKNVQKTVSYAEASSLDVTKVSHFFENTLNHALCLPCH